MKQSLTGMFRNTAAALRVSEDDMACAMAFTLGQLVDNLRTVKDGGATVDEFFEHYVFDSKVEVKLADTVDNAHYACMNSKECAECGNECLPHWTYCPSCGAQGRVGDGEREAA